MVTRFPGSTGYKTLWLATGTWGTVCLSSVVLKPNVLPEEHVTGGKPAIEWEVVPTGNRVASLPQNPTSLGNSRNCELQCHSFCKLKHPPNLLTWDGRILHGGKGVTPTGVETPQLFHFCDSVLCFVAGEYNSCSLWYRRRENAVQSYFKVTVCCYFTHSYGGLIEQTQSISFILSFL